MGEVMTGGATAAGKSGETTSVTGAHTHTHLSLRPHLQLHQDLHLHSQTVPSTLSEAVLLAVP